MRSTTLHSNRVRFRLEPAFLRWAALLTLLGIAATTPAQNAQEEARLLDRLRSGARVSYQDGALATLAAAGQIDTATLSALTTAERRALMNDSFGLTVFSPDQALTHAQFAYLVMEAFPLPRSLWYRLAPSPRYALRELRFRRLLAEELPAGEEIDGPTALALLSRTRQWSLRRGAVLGSPVSPGAAPGPGVGPLQETELALRSETDLALAEESREFVHYGELALDAGQPLGARGELALRAFVGLESDDEGTQVTGDLQALNIHGTVPLRPSRSAAGTAEGSGSASPAGQEDFPRSPVFTYRLGRLELQDFSAFVLNSPADGLSLRYTGPVLDSSLSGGYTGLTLRNDTRLVGSQAEAQDAGNLLAPSRGLIQLSLAFPELISRQSLLFAGIASLDLPELPGGTADAEAPRYDSLHAGAGLQGPLSRELFYTLFGYYQRPWYRSTGATEAGNAFAAGGSLRYYREDLAFSALEIRGLYASGDRRRSSRLAAPESETTLFLPVSEPDLGNDLNAVLSNIWFAELAYSLRPFAPSYPTRTGSRISLAVQGIGRPAGGPGTVENLDTDAEAGYLGTNGVLEFRYRPTSDFAITATGSIFAPGAAQPGGGGSGFAAFEGRLEFTVETSL